MQPKMILKKNSSHFVIGVESDTLATSHSICENLEALVQFLVQGFRGNSTCS